MSLTDKQLEQLDENLRNALEAQHRKTWALAMETAGNIMDKSISPKREHTIPFAAHVDAGIARVRSEPCPPIEATKDK